MPQDDIEFAGLAGEFEDSLVPSALQGQRTSALSIKLTSVLAASFADSEIREALAELDARNVENTVEARRRLRTDLQKDVIEANGEIVKDFGQVAMRLKRIGATIETLDQYCDVMKTHMVAARRETAPILDEAASLVSQRVEVEAKQQLLSAFNNHFTVSDEELDILTSFNFPVDDRFFSLLTRMKRIHSDCEVLLGADSQQLGVELMERSSKQLDNAFQRLFRWIEKEFNSLDLENPRMSISIRRALRILAERPALFEACLDSFAEARERNLADGFYAALTGFSTQTDDRTTKPMDYYAHDSLRFVGDMLAWTHSAAVSERESLEVLFISEGDEMAAGVRAGLESEPWHRTDGSQGQFDGKIALEKIINRDMAGVARALRQRIEQVIKSDEDAVLAYKIAHLVDFYQLTFERILGPTSEVIGVLSEIQEAAMSQFRLLMQDHIRVLSTMNPGSGFSVPSDLSPPEFLLEAIDRLRQVMKSFDASFTSPESREHVFAPTLELSLEPYLQACKGLTTDSDPPLKEPASSIFELNVLGAVLPALSRFDFTALRHETLSLLVRDAQQRLTEYQYNFFLHNSGIESLHAVLVQLSPADPSDIVQIPSLEPCKPENLAVASQTLDEFLPDALVEGQEELGLLQDKHAAEVATVEAAARFCEIFDQIEERLLAADDMAWSEKEGSRSQDAVEATEEELNGDRRRLRGLFPRTGAEIRVLLS